MDWGLWAVAVFGCLLMLGYVRMQRRHKQRNRDLIEQTYLATLTAHDIEAAEIRRETLNLGRQEDDGGVRPFEVHRILHLSPDRWYLYIHVEGSEPLITAISQRRAQNAIAQ